MLEVRVLSMNSLKTLVKVVDELSKSCNNTHIETKEKFNMCDPFEEYERELEAKAKKEIEKEDAEWALLSQEEKDKINKKREDMFEYFDMFGIIEEDDSDEDEDF